MTCADTNAGLVPDIRGPPSRQTRSRQTRASGACRLLANDRVGAAIGADLELAPARDEQEKGRGSPDPGLCIGIPRGAVAARSPNLALPIAWKERLMPVRGDSRFAADAPLDANSCLGCDRRRKRSSREAPRLLAAKGVSTGTGSRRLFFPAKYAPGARGACTSLRGIASVPRPLPGPKSERGGTTRARRRHARALA